MLVSVLRLIESWFAPVAEAVEFRMRCRGLYEFPRRIRGVGIFVVCLVDLNRP
jgi:hypothetical protein